MKLNATSALLTATFVVAALATSGAAQAAKKPAAKAAAEAPAAPLNSEQLSAAERVLTGAQACEFGQSVQVQSVPGKQGWFDVAFKGKHYLMAPEPTTTGAVRLEDKKNGMMWLQIASKSMLMNSRVGQRMVDDCVHPSQKS
jgi:hypothetical protein